MIGTLRSIPTVGSIGPPRARRGPLSSGAPEIDVFEVITAEQLLLAVVLLSIAYVVSILLDRGLTAFADRLLVDRFRLTGFIPVLKVLVYGIAVYEILFRIVGPSEQVLVAFAGVLGAALGFGLRDLVADALGGLLLLVERPYQIGDVVDINGDVGEVVGIGLRSTRLETLDDTMILVPNHLLFSNAVANANDGNAEMLVEIEFYLDPGTDVATAAAIVEEALVTSRYVYAAGEYPIDVRIEDEPAYTEVRGKAYVNDLRNRGAFESDVSRRVLNAFDDAGIEQTRIPSIERLDGM